jgi:hypothetical protein
MGLTASRKTRHSQAALVVQKFYQRAAYQGLRNVFHGVEKPSAGLVRPQIWAFGYQLDSAKAEAYRESLMPLFIVPTTYRIDFEGFALQLIQAAEPSVRGLRQALARALYGKYIRKDGGFKWDYPISAKGNKTRKEPKEAMFRSVINDTTTRFWKETEHDFYDLLADAEKALNKGEEATLKALRERWWGILQRKVLGLYNEVTDYGVFHNLDPRSVARARLELGWALKSTCRRALDLPKDRPKGDKAGEGRDA